ncbi:MAG: sigma-E factor negative regulatory protein [Gammaproteobacteria bacterium]|nr:sigma-E factor negative regulatory protein [Gammaproteobacteria bacterium]MDE2346510.1 sigma-E factor negative regulatory protein [Gammaproteobacteria bacterium]
MMSDKLREQISALVDNELPADEHELLIRRFSMDKHLCLSWERYHLVGEAMRKSLPQADMRGFADRVMKVIADNSAGVKSREAKLASQIGKSVAGAGLAACVALVVIVSLHHLNGSHILSASAPSEIVPSQINAQTRNVAYGMPNAAAWNGNMPEVQARLSNYVINHNEIATAIEQQGMLPYFYMSQDQYSQTTWSAAYTSHNPDQQDKR